MAEHGRLAARILSLAAPVFSTPWMRRPTRLLSDLHARLYRLTDGRAQVRAFPTAVLTVTGRRTGQPRTVPLVYARDGDRYVVAAAYAGSDHDPVWWLNLRAHPDAELQVGSRRVPVRADPAPAAERDRLWRLLVDTYPPFTTYQERTTRRIPVIVLTPLSPRLQ
jgi:deazaflavin-dependent oxidoreductase (nitroreductase family)